MPAQTSTIVKIQDVAIKLHRVGKGPAVLFLHGADGVPQWLPFFDALAERLRGAGAGASGLRRVGRSAVDPQRVGPGHVLSRLPRALGLDRVHLDRPFARRLDRGRDSRSATARGSAASR